MQPYMRHCGSRGGGSLIARLRGERPFRFVAVEVIALTRTKGQLLTGSKRGLTDVYRWLRLPKDENCLESVRDVRCRSALSVIASRARL
jgi:hypothetical protein